MSRTDVDRIADTLLYEGYVLYPYRATAVKNRRRWTIGALAPRAFAEAAASTEAWSLQAECLVRGDDLTAISVRVRFLQPVERIGDDATWQEAVEREIVVADATLAQLGEREASISWRPESHLVAKQCVQHALEIDLIVSAAPLADGLYRLSVHVANRTPIDPAIVANRDAVMLRSLASAHVILTVRGGQFVSLTDPPESLKPFADGCRNVGVWPVLVGDSARLDTVIASPIILSDFPRVAPESPGDFFDGTEIDEMLALRIRALTNDEKRQMSELDRHTRTLLTRTEGMTEPELARLHGANRPADSPQPGDRVRLRPRGRADALDVLLAGKIATITSVEQDFDGGTHVCVTIDDDPGRDLGLTGMPGHRFFYRPDEVEPLADGESP